MKNWFTLLVSFVLLSGAALADGLKAKAIPVVMKEDPVDLTVAIKPVPPEIPNVERVIGTPTTLTGFYDYQSNGGSPQYVRVDPANGWIHVIYMLADDSANVSASRGTGYALSTDGGVTWNNFSNVRVPARRSGFPTLDLGKGTIDGAPLVANHNDAGGGVVCYVYIDFPAGGGAFAELAAPPVLGAGEPIWPYVAGAHDGSIVMSASVNPGPANHLTRTVDFLSWSSWATWPGPNSSGGRYPTQATASGKVSSILHATSTGTFLLESSDHGATWGATAPEFHPAAPPGRVMGADTFQAWIDGDFVFNGDAIEYVGTFLGIGANDPTDAGYIHYWSNATGWVEIARPSNTPGAITMRNRTQVNYFTMGWSTIGRSGSNIVVAWSAMQSDTGTGGWNYSDIFASASTNGGATWSNPYNLTQTPNLDERYPHISKWNEAGYFNIVWQEDTQPGAHAFNDGAPITRSWQTFAKIAVADILNDVKLEDPVASSYKLSQNYPNPFNPATQIEYTIPAGSHVTLKVYNVVGQEVATLVDGFRTSGSYLAEFDASSLSSGVYFYTLTAGKFVQTNKMVLMK